MKVMGPIRILLLFSVVVLFCFESLAAMLPYSSHYEGRSDYGGGYIDFAVYDTHGGNEYLDAGFSAPGSGQYIYAYQIFTADFATVSIETFSILGIGQGAISTPLNDNIGFENDSPDLPEDEGISPYDAFITPDATKGVWLFDDGLLAVGEHSYFLLLSSDYNWKAGEYTFEAPEEGPFPIPTPEPATIALLALGGAAVLRRRRKAASVGSLCGKTTASKK